MPPRDRKGGVKLVGDWKTLNKTLSAAPKRVKEAAIRLPKSEAVFFAGEMRRGIENQAPGGRRFRPLSAATLLARRLAGIGGRKALIREDPGLIDSIDSRRISGGGWFAGIFDRDYARIGRIHEEGAGPFVVAVTPKMRRFLHGVLFRGRPRERGGSSGGSLTVTIPARPFVAPTFRKLGRRQAAARRILPQYARIFRGTMGRA